MDPSLKALFFFVDLVLPLTVGAVAHRRGWLSEARSDDSIRFGIFVVAPLLNALAFWAVALDPMLIWLPVLGVFMMIVPGVVGHVLARYKYEGPLDRGGFVMAVMLQNRGIAGALSVFILFGEAGFAWARVVMLLAPIVVFLICFPMADRYRASYDGRQGERPPWWKGLVSKNQLPVVGCAIGLALNVVGPARPAVAGQMFPWLVHLLAWCVVLPLGTSLDFRGMRQYLGRQWEIMAIKFLLTPAATYAAGWLVGVRGDMLLVVTILGASPTAINAVVVGRLYKLNVQLTMASFVYTMAAYLFVVFPLIWWWAAAMGKI